MHVYSIVSYIQHYYINTGINIVISISGLVTPHLLPCLYLESISPMHHVATIMTINGDMNLYMKNERMMFSYRNGCG